MNVRLHRHSYHTTFHWMELMLETYTGHTLHSSFPHTSFHVLHLEQDCMMCYVLQSDIMHGHMIHHDVKMFVILLQFARLQHQLHTINTAELHFLSHGSTATA